MANILSITEGRICFQFDENYWSVYKPDDENAQDFEKIRNAIQNTKCVDLLAIYEKADEQSLLLIEFKDFELVDTNPAEYKTKMIEKYEELPQKVRDSLSAILNSAKNSTHERDFFQKFVKFFQKEEAKIYVSLLILVDEHFINTNKQIELKANELKKKLRSKTEWINASKKDRVLHQSHLPNFASQFEGLTITIT